jgi:hypothetical protein
MAGSKALIWAIIGRMALRSRAPFVPKRRDKNLFKSMSVHLPGNEQEINRKLKNKKIAQK